MEKEIKHISGSAGGFLVGRSHANNGIKAINKSTGLPLEMEGGEVVITKTAVDDDELREFEGEMLTNRQILSKINESGGGVSFALGGDIPTELYFTGNSYKYGGDTLTDYQIAHKISSCGCKHQNDGLSKNKTIKDIAAMHNVSVDEIETQLIKGIEVESEHSDNFETQMQIAMDHLVENPKYYDILAEAKLEKGGSILLAPNGKPSNLSSENYHLVRTPQFKAWFGDWETDFQNASKVVDENGEPLVVYHGTNTKFTEFKSTKFPTAGYFAKDITYSKSFAKTITEYRKGKENLMSLFLNIRNPFDASKLPGDKEYTDKDLKEIFPIFKNIKWGVNYIFGWMGKEDVINSIKQNGYDGIIFNEMSVKYWKEYDFDNEMKELKTVESYIAFEPNQIKLADGTNTTFDANSNDIRFEKGGTLKNHKNEDNIDNVTQVVDEVLDGPNIVASEGAYFEKGGFLPTDIPQKLRSDIAFLVDLQDKKENNRPSGGWDINLFKSSFFNKVKKLPNNQAKVVLDFLTALEETVGVKPIFSKNHKIWENYTEEKPVSTGSEFEIPEGGNYSFQNKFGSFTSVKVMLVDAQLRPSTEYFSLAITGRKKTSDGRTIIQNKPLITMPISQYQPYMTDLKNRVNQGTENFVKESDDLSENENKKQNSSNLDWDFTFTSGPSKGKKLSEQKLDFIDVYDDNIYSLNFQDEGYFHAKTEETKGLLTITHNPVKISVILNENDILSSQRIKRRLKKLAEDSSRKIVINPSSSKSDRNLFPYLFVSERDADKYELANDFYQKLETPRQEFRNLLTKSLKREPKFKVGDFVKYETGDLETERWVGEIKEVKDFETEFAYRIDAYTRGVEETPMFDAAKNNEKYEVQLNPSNDLVFNQAKNRYNRIMEKRQEEKQKTYDLGTSFAGGVTVVWDRNQTKNGDYKTIAHIPSIGSVKYFEENLPQYVIDYVEGMKSTNKAKEPQTQTNYQISNYRNPYEVNRAIEQLIDSKESGFTPNEIEFISNYSGYGGLEKQGSFSDEELKGLLYEYFTPDAIVKKMWALAYKYGFGTIENPHVMEPSVGTGNFFKYAPINAELFGNEINRFSKKVCEILYPKAMITLQPFEKNFISKNNSIKNKLSDIHKYHLVIGNPPYGRADSKFLAMGEKDYTKASNFTEYFITRGLDLLHPGGLLIFVVGAEQYNGGTLFLDSGISVVKKHIFDKAQLVDAYRLPTKIFERTGVASEILVFKKR